MKDLRTHIKSVTDVGLTQCDPQDIGKAVSDVDTSSRQYVKKSRDLNEALFQHFLRWRPELIEKMVPAIQNNVTDGLVYEQ